MSRLQITHSNEEEQDDDQDQTQTAPKETALDKRDQYANNILSVDEGLQMNTFEALKGAKSSFKMFMMGSKVTKADKAGIDSLIKQVGDAVTQTQS